MGYYTKQAVAMKTFLPDLIANMKTEGWVETTKNILQVVPIMAGNTGIDVMVPIQSTQVNTTTNGTWNVFNRNATTYWSSSASPTPASPQYAGIDFGVGNEKAIAKYVVSSPATINGQMPKDWTFEASNDLTTWTTLDTKTGIAFVINDVKTFTFTNITKYRYYRLNATAISTTGNVIIGCLDLYEDPTQATAFESVMTSVGTSGTDNIILSINSGYSMYANGNWIQLAYAETYDSGTNTFTNKLATGNKYYFASINGDFTNPTTQNINYYMDITKDKVMFATVLNGSATSPATNAFYGGLIKRYSTETDNSAQAFILGMQAGNASPYLLKNRAKIVNSTYTYKHITHSYSPSVWGDIIFASPIPLEGTNEGMRGELDGLYTNRIDSMINEDIVSVGGVNYKAIIITTYGNNAFPQSGILIKLPL